MKNTKILSNMTIFATSALLLASCGLLSNENVIPDPISTTAKSDLQKLYETSFNGKSIFINGDTIINQKDIQLHSNTTTANFDAIKNTNGTFRMVAIGGGMTAGARDGGLYRNGQLTAFPNLIARQMGIEFKQPLFAEKEANGFGYKVLSSMSNGVPKYKVVSNNVALLKTTPIIELNPYNGEIDNLGTPFIGVWNLNYERRFFPSSYWDLANPYRTRILNKVGEYTLLNKFQSSKFDFFTMELGLDDYLIGSSIGTIFDKDQISLSQPPNELALIYAQKQTRFGLILNVPDIFDFPFINLVSLERIRKINQAEIYTKETTGLSKVFAVPQGSYVIANALSDSLLNPNIPTTQKRGLSFNNPLEANEVYTANKVNALKQHVGRFNGGLNFYPKNFNYPIVDLYTLFKKITSNSYVTNDGIKANNQNFFSSDGMFPNAFGQAIIANECIKTMNEFYKTNIPLIQTAYYLNK